MRSRGCSLDRPLRVSRGDVAQRAAGTHHVSDTAGNEVVAAEETRFAGASVVAIEDDDGSDIALVTIALRALDLTAMTPAQLTTNTDNWNPVDATDPSIDLDAASIIRASTDASRNLTGIVAPSAERLIILANIGANDLVLKHDVTSTAANRFLCPDNADVTLKRNTAVPLVYDATSSRWRVIGGSGGGGGTGTITHAQQAAAHALALRSYR